jgi:hypothetical protein
VYTLNLLFNLNNANGRFSGDRRGGVLSKSNNWLLLKPAEPDNPDPSVFNPEDPAIWTDQGEAGTLLIQNDQNPNQHICVRIAPDPSGLAVDLTNTKVSLVVAFGASLPSAQAHSSPFTTDDTEGGPVVTTFRFSSNANTSAGWFFPLGRIRRVPHSQNVTHRYQFAVGAIVEVRGGITRHYGEDPEMDVGT